MENLATAREHKAQLAEQLRRAHRHALALALALAPPRLSFHDHGQKTASSLIRVLRVPSGMVPGMCKCRITRHSGCVLTLAVISPSCARRVDVATSRGSESGVIWSFIQPHALFLLRRAVATPAPPCPRWRFCAGWTSWAKARAARGRCVRPRCAGARLAEPLSRLGLCGGALLNAAGNAHDLSDRLRASDTPGSLYCCGGGST